MHRRRLAFIERLQSRIGDQLMLFGSGFAPVSDKAQAIDACRYHLVLENSADEHYWSEKLADAYLGWALPVFSGTALIKDYFPPGAFEAIDTSKPEAAIETVVRLLADDPWQSRLPQLGEARRRILHDYNFMTVIAKVAAQLPEAAAGPAASTPLLSSGAATVRGRISRAIGLR